MTKKGPSFELSDLLQQVPNEEDISGPLFSFFEPVKIRRKRLKILRLFPTPAEWTNRGRDEDNKAPEEF